jgi:hypothetical protein
LTPLHPLFRRRVEPSPERRAELLATIQAAAREIWPDGRSLCLSVIVRPPQVHGGNESIKLDQTEPPEPKAGTVGAAAKAAGRALLGESARFVRNPEALDDERPDFTPAGWVRFRTSYLADSLAHFAGNIPIEEFGPAEWRAFLSETPERFLGSPEMDHLRRCLAAAGLTVPKS